MYLYFLMMSYSFIQSLVSSQKLEMTLMTPFVSSSNIETSCTNKPQSLSRSNFLFIANIRYSIKYNVCDIIEFEKFYWASLSVTFIFATAILVTFCWRQKMFAVVTISFFIGLKQLYVTQYELHIIKSIIWLNAYES